MKNKGQNILIHFKKKKYNLNISNTALIFAREIKRS